MKYFLTSPDINEQKPPRLASSQPQLGPGLGKNYDDLGGAARTRSLGPGLETQE